MSRVKYALPAALVLVAVSLFGVMGSGGISKIFAQGAKGKEEPAAGAQLPKPDPEFKGKIGETYKDSMPKYPQPLKAPKGSPNVLLVLLDDVGFGMCSTFGGPVPTPQMEKLAKNG